jgi:acetyl-CoA synthetase
MTNNVETKLKEIAGRVKALREEMGLTVEQAAKKIDLTTEEYLKFESGTEDLNFTFVYKFANLAGVEISDIMEGSSPALKEYAVTRKGQGSPITRRTGYLYQRLASRFKNKLCEPFRVVVPYSEEALNPPYHLVTHNYQELNIVVKGTLKVIVGDSSEVLHEGDSIYFDSTKPHAEFALGGEDCEFYAIILNPESWGKGENFTTPYNSEEIRTDNVTNVDAANLEDAVYTHYLNGVLGEDGQLVDVDIDVPACKKFNFAFDCVDVIADKTPNKTAMVWVAKDCVTDRIFTFADMKKYSNMTANYFKSLGIKKGDKVVLVLKRHYQFWFAMIGLEKIGAVAIPATHLLRDHDYEYRFNAAGVKAVFCTADDDAAVEAEKAAKVCGVETLIICNGQREGWHDFNEEFKNCSDVFERPEDYACGYDPMVMFFTSGTTGYPKMALHSYMYAIGHITTAKYWQNVDPNGLHFSISDTGWGKALWGKLYGQWLCEAPVFTFDFDRFKAEEILPMFAKYNITTFCAPPTMFRFFIKEDLSKYDLSSLKYAVTAGEALNPEVFNRFMAATGIRLMEGFGQTETTLAIANLVGSKLRIGSMGKPNPLYDVKILDPDGNECKPGETGEICINTQNYHPKGLFLQYYLAPDLTNEAWHDGWYHTGDTAWQDEDGFIWYVGRTDDVIKSSGYRIGPFEIENVIMELPYVLECAVTGAPDPQGVRGIVVKASITLVKGSREPSDELVKEIQNYVKEKTAPYKYPRIVEFVDELPKTISGKIRRAAIRGDAKDNVATEEQDKN